MTFSPIYLLYGAIFLGAILLIEGLYYLISDRHGTRNVKNRRMGLLAAGSSTREALDILRRQPVERGAGLGPLAGIAEWCGQLITSSGASMTVRRLFAMMLGLTAFVAMMLFTFAKSGVLPGVFGTFLGAMIPALLVGVGGPILQLSGKKSARLKAFAAQLPDALEIMARSLKAGHPVSAAMDLVTKELPDPMGTEIGIAVDEMTYGLDLRDALENLASRIQLQEFQFVVVAIGIQHETGGNLAEILTSLSSVIRQRFRMKMKIRALSGEGRVSAQLLTALPFLTFAVVYMGNPAFYLDVIDDPLFWPIASSIAMLLVTGIFIMYRMVNFRI